MSLLRAWPVHHVYCLDESHKTISDQSHHPRASDESVLSLSRCAALFCSAATTDSVYDGLDGGYGCGWLAGYESRTEEMLGMIWRGGIYMLGLNAKRYYFCVWWCVWCCLMFPLYDVVNIFEQTFSSPTFVPNGRPRVEDAPRSRQGAAQAPGSAAICTTAALGAAPRVLGTAAMERPRRVDRGRRARRDRRRRCRRPWKAQGKERPACSSCRPALSRPGRGYPSLPGQGVLACRVPARTQGDGLQVMRQRH